MKRKVNVNKIKLNKLVLMFIFLFFIIVIGRLSFLALAKEIDDINIKQFVSNRNTRKKTIYAKRGTIYDSVGNPLAQTVNSYTVIAYLSPSRSEGFKTPQHVVDKEYTAELLSPIIGMSEEAILYLLNKNLYQVELGPGGRDITELKKEQIDDLNLPGISFISSYKRYYQNDDFASYVLGYVKTTDDGELINPMEKLRTVYPNTMLITRERKRQNNKDNTSAKGEYKSKSKLDLFKEFYNDLGDGDYTSEKECVLIETIENALKESE